MSASIERVLVLGTGYVGSAVARAARARGLRVCVSARRPERAAELRRAGFALLESAHLDAGIAAHVDGATHVVLAFPPDGATEVRIAAALARAGAVSFVSTTGVYGALSGVVDDATPVPAPANESRARTLAAEELVRALGGSVLRCPGIYGPDRGLHVRVVSGVHRMPGAGAGYLSRIHVADLAVLVLALGTRGVRGETFVVGDACPAPQIEVVRWIAAAYGVPLPPVVAPESVHESLRADRRVDGARARARLGVSLCFPSYREGMAPAVTGLVAPL